jgi:hypothetical protein
MPHAARHHMPCTAVPLTAVGEGRNTEPVPQTNQQKRLVIDSPPPPHYAHCADSHTHTHTLRYTAAQHSARLAQVCRSAHKRFEFFLFSDLLLYGSAGAPWLTSPALLCARHAMQADSSDRISAPLRACLRSKRNLSDAALSRSLQHSCARARPT